MRFVCYALNRDADPRDLASDVAVTWDQVGHFPAQSRLSTADTVGGSITTTANLGIGSMRTGYINTAGDQDWYRVTLTAGQVYEINLEGRTLSDAYLRLMDSTGTLVAENDDRGFMDHDARLYYRPTTTGTYYINAAGFDAEIGSYAVHFLAIEADFIYGAGGPAGIASTGGDAFTGSINWGTRLNTSTPIDVFFVPAGQDMHDGESILTSAGWTEFQITQFMDALGRFSDVANISFRQTTNADEADFIVGSQEFSLFQAYFQPPRLEGGTAGQGAGVFNLMAEGFTETGLLRGGLGYSLLLHEIGHGLGMAHPHDQGGSSTLMPGVETDEFGNHSLGIGNANQGVNTVMSYNFGWQTAPGWAESTPEGYGYNRGLMALDIAVIQQHYGANTNFNNTDTVYVLASANVNGTGYQAIWDTGGTDLIRYSGSRACTIDLRIISGSFTADELNRVSYATGIWGGYTIARDVVIENATSGNGHDRLMGNDVANVLTGNGGNDDLRGYGGHDLLFGGAGNDNLNGGLGNDTISGGDGIDTVLFVGSNNITVDLRLAVAQSTGHGNDILTSIENVTTGDGADTVRGTDGTNTLRGGNANDRFYGNGGNDTLYGDAGNDTLYGGSGNDTFYGGTGNDRMTGNSGADRFVFRSTDNGADVITDFTVGLDRIDISTIAAATNMAWVNANTVDVSGNAVITLGSGYRITLIGVTESQLTASDFLF